MAEKKKEEQSKTSTDAPAKTEQGFNWNELIPPILSALAGMGGGYLLYGKPTQDQVKEIASRIIDMEKKINTLWEERAQSKKQEKLSMNGAEDTDEEEDDDDYLLSKHQNTYAKKQQRKQLTRLR